MHPPMKICLIINPNAGKRKGLRVAELVSEAFQRLGVYPTLLVSDHPGGTREIAEHLDTSSYDGVVVVGGDGSLFEVINGLFSRGGTLDVPLGQIPVGTGNSFLRDVVPPDMESNWIGAALDLIAAGKTRTVDTGRFSCSRGQYYFINLLGAGFVSNVAHRAGKYKGLGSLSYIIGVLEEVMRLQRAPMKLTIDGRVLEREAIFVEICNSRFTGGTMMMAPSARIDDGLLDIVLLNAVSRRTILELLPTIFKGAHVDHPAVEVFQGRSITVESEIPLLLTPDGETFGETPFSAEVHHERITMFG